MAQIDGPLPLLGFALRQAAGGWPSTAEALAHGHGNMEGVAGRVAVVAMGVATEQPLRFQMVDVGKQVVIAGGHAVVEKLIGDLLQVPVPHFFWVSANHLIQHTTLESEWEIIKFSDLRNHSIVMEYSVIRTSLIAGPGPPKVQQHTSCCFNQLKVSYKLWVWMVFLCQT